MKLTRREREERCIPDSLKLATRLVVREMGFRQFADQYGHGYTSLTNNLNPELTDRQPTAQQIEDALAAGAARGTVGPMLEYIGQATNHVFLPLPKVQTTGHPDLLDALSRLSSRIARLGRDVYEAIADGDVDADERALIEKDGLAAIAAIYTLMDKTFRYGKEPGSGE